MDFIESVPKLNSAISYDNLRLTPTEGYLLSRIDGVSSVGDIISLSGLPSDQAMEIIKSLWNKKVFIIEGAEVHDDKENNGIALNEDERLAIEKMANMVQKGTFYQILSVPFNAKPEQIKIKFFDLSKSFHPDRYFRKNIGKYKDMLTMIFKKISAAYEALYDPQKKRQYDLSLARMKTKNLKSSSGSDAVNDGITPIFRTGASQNRFAQPKHGADGITAGTDTGKENGHYKKTTDGDKAERIRKTVKMEKPPAHASGIEYEIDIIKESLDKHMVEQALVRLNGLKDDIRDSRIPLLMADYYLKENDLLTAKDYVQTAIEYDSKNTKAYMMLGDIYMKFKLYRNALKVYKTIMDIEPDNVDAVKMINNINSLIKD